MSKDLHTRVSCPICESHMKFTGVTFSEEKHLNQIHLETFKENYYNYKPALYQIYKCNSCKHQCCWPMPLEDYLDVVYGKHFYDNYFGGIGYHKAFQVYLKRDFELKLRLIQKLCTENKLNIPDISVLDIGSGPGYFSKMLQDSGIACVPVDTNQDAVKLGRRIGVKVFNVDLRSKNNPLYGKKYDIVISWATIEHIPDAIDFVRLAYRYVKEDGLFICDTGNASDLYLIGDSGFSNWIYPPMHVHYFSVTSLFKCLQKAGFSMIKIYPRSEILFENRLPGKLEELITLLHYIIKTWRRILINILKPTRMREKPGEYASIMLAIAKKEKLAHGS